MPRDRQGHSLLLAFAVVVGLLFTTNAHAADPPAGSFTPRGTFAHPESLVDAVWLAAHLNDPNLRIVDARMPFERKLYEAAHIPGAVFVDTFRLPIAPPAAFAVAMGRLGIGNDTTVVVYESGTGEWCARLWWALRYHGHEDVRVLNGGLRQWLVAGLPLSSEAPVVSPAVFAPDVQAHWRASAGDVRSAIDDPDVALVDAIHAPSYTGDMNYFGRAGHIPSAVNLPTTDLTDTGMQTVLPPADLSRVLRRAGLDPSRRHVIYCGAGFVGAFGAFVLHLMGFDDVALFPGGLVEWVADPSNPMATVP
jgi:thiosulfate/3-mercaptopyruvate sulfurtransferase